MPTFHINHTSPEGHFSLTFGPDTLPDFYGLTLFELDAFRRYGVLPDNDIAVNKLINALGQNLLSLKEKQSELVNQNDALNKDKLFYSKLEALSNAMTVSILTTMAPLEKLRNGSPAASEHITLTLREIGKVYTHYLTQLETLNQDADAVQKQRITQLLAAVTQQMSKWITLSEQSHDILTNDILRSYYQDVLNDFHTIQRDLTLYQRPYLGMAEFANQSATEAYQRASYELESHLFSEDIPSDKQLWIHDLKNCELKRSVSTKEMPSMRSDLALKAGIALGIQEEPDASAAPPSVENLSLYSKYLIYKEKIKCANLEDKQKTEDKEKKTDAAPKQASRQIISKVVDLEDALSTGEFSEDITEILLNEQLVNTYPCSDIFSSLGSCFSFLKTIECEMAAKHPVVTTGVFLTSTLAFTATGLASIGIAESSMRQFVLILAKCLTLNGHIGISAAEMQFAIEILNKFILSQQHGFLLEVIIKNGLILPTALATAVDVFVNGVEGNDLLSNLYTQTFADVLEGTTTATYAQEIILKLLITSLVISTAYGLEIGLVLLNKMMATATHANLLLGVLTLKELGYYHSAVEQMFSTFTAIHEVKSAGRDFGNNYRDLFTSEEVAADIWIISRLGHLYKNSPQRFQRFIAQYELSTQIKAQARKHIKFLKREFKGAPEFLMQLGLPYQSKVGMLGATARGIVGGLLGLVVAVTLIVPIGMIFATFFSPRFDNWLTNITSQYKGSFFKDVASIILSGGKYMAALIVALCTLIPGLIFPPLMFSSYYKKIIFNEVKITQKNKNGESHIQNMPNLIVKNGIKGTARLISTGIAKKVFYPLFGLIFIVLSAPFILFNLLLATVGGIFGKLFGDGSFLTVFNLTMAPTYLFIRSESVDEGLKIPLIAIPRLFLFVLLPIKIVLMSVSELARRLPMILIDEIFNLSLIVNALFTRNDKKIGLKALGSQVSKLVYYPLLYLPLYLGAQLKALVQGLIHGMAGEYGFFDNFNSKRKQSLKNAWMTQINEFYQRTALNLQTVKDAKSIIQLRDKVLSSFSSGYFAVKQFFGKALTKVRNFFMRQPEEWFQSEAIKLSQSPMLALRSAREVEMHSLSRLDESLLSASTHFPRPFVSEGASEGILSTQTESLSTRTEAP